MSKTKIGIDGKPFDPATEAAHGLSVLRAFVERAAYMMTIPEDEYEGLNRSLNFIADRLQTAVALELKIERQRKVLESAKETLNLIREAEGKR